MCSHGQRAASMQSPLHSGLDSCRREGLHNGFSPHLSGLNLTDSQRSHLQILFSLGVGADFQTRNLKGAHCNNKIPLRTGFCLQGSGFALCQRLFYNHFLHSKRIQVWKSRCVMGEAVTHEKLTQTKLLLVLAALRFAGLTNSPKNATRI